MLHMIPWYIIYIIVIYIDIFIQKYFYIKKEKFYKNDTKRHDMIFVLNKNIYSTKNYV